MKLRPLISLLSISLLSLALQKVRAQTAEGFFHTGAQSYLSNNVEGARQEVDKGLKLFPNDVKLQKLDQLLKQQQQQQQQQQQNQSQQKQNQSKQDKEQKQKQDEQQKQQQQKQQQQQKNQQQDQRKQADQQKQKEQQGQPGQMTPDEAKKLLDSQKDDESLLPANQNDKHREKSLKDW
jgi:outer membrane biosynthesis protein TonB